MWVGGCIGVDDDRWCVGVKRGSTWTSTMNDDGTNVLGSVVSEDTVVESVGFGGEARIAVFVPE